MLNKIPVCRNLREVESFLEQHPKAKVCLYLAHKNQAEWEKSTSRVYMNQITDRLIYLPVDIEKEDYELIENIYQLSEQKTQIIAINQTQPHKSNPVLKNRFQNCAMPPNVDALIKNQTGNLEPFDLNGPSFMSWFEAEIGSFENKQVVILGVGGVGEPIARKISKQQPQKLWLVDPVSKQTLAEELSNDIPTAYTSELKNCRLSLTDIVFINCAGKEGVSETGAIDFLNRYQNQGNIFIDLRPQLKIKIVEIAQSIGWQAYTGSGMNARNDYTLLSKICDLTALPLPSFEAFQKLVTAAS